VNFSVVLILFSMNPMGVDLRKYLPSLMVSMADSTHKTNSSSVMMGMKYWQTPKDRKAALPRGNGTSMSMKSVFMLVSLRAKLIGFISK